LCACVTPNATGQDQPVLNVFGSAQPSVTTADQEVTYTAYIYSTSEMTETMRLQAIVEPWVRLDTAGVIQDTTLGAVVCVPSLFQLDCEVPIKVYYPVTMFVQLRTPNLDLTSCEPSIALHVTADLPNRHAEKIINVPVKDGYTCTYVPIVISNDIPQ